MLNKVEKNKKADSKKKARSGLVFFGPLFYSRKGMTLIELIVVIAIISIGSSLVLSFSPVKNQAKLKAAQTQIAAGIKQAQSYALQGKMVGSPSNTPKAFGLNTQAPSTYVIFYCTSADCANPVTMETISLGGVAVANSQVSFDVPNGNPTLSSGASDLNITLTFSSQTKTVTVKPGGSIVEN